VEQAAINCQVILLRHLQSTCLRTGFMTIGTMWALKLKSYWSFISLSTSKICEGCPEGIRRLWRLSAPP